MTRSACLSVLLSALAFTAPIQAAPIVIGSKTFTENLGRYGLVVLEDDLGFFPDYSAVPLVTDTLPAGAKDALLALGGTIDEKTMRSLNAGVVVEGRSFASVADAFLDVGGAEDGNDVLWQRIARASRTACRIRRSRIDHQRRVD